MKNKLRYEKFANDFRFGRDENELFIDAMGIGT